MPAVWVALAATLATQAEGVGPGMTYQRALVLDGEWWRLLGAYLTHWSPSHFFGNVAALLLLGALAGRRQPGLPWLVAAAAACSIVLWCWLPEIERYRGSSPLVAALLPSALLVLWQQSRSTRVAAVLLAAAFAAKTALDAANLPVWSTLPGGVRSTWELHLVGLAMGITALAHGEFLRRQRSRSSKPSS